MICLFAFYRNITKWFHSPTKQMRSAFGLPSVSLRDREFFSQLKHYIKKESPNTYEDIYNTIQEILASKITKEHLSNYLKHSYTPLDILNADHKGRRIECCLGKRYFETYNLPFTYQ